MIRIVVASNSLGAGVGDSAEFAYPVQMQALLGNEFEIINHSYSGYTTPQLLALYPGTIAPSYSPSADANILILHEAINHIALAGATLAEAIQVYVDFIAAAHATGFLVIAGSGTMRSSMWMNGVNTTVDDMQNRILDFDAYWRSGWQNHCEGFCDFARAPYNDDPLFFSTKFTGNGPAPPYVDTAHVDRTGSAVWAQAGADSVLALVAGLLPAATINLGGQLLALSPTGVGPQIGTNRLELITPGAAGDSGLRMMQGGVVMGVREGGT